MCYDGGFDNVANFNRRFLEIKGMTPKEFRRQGAARFGEPAASASIVILGEALYDLFPERAVIGGAPFNVARNLAAFGAAPLMVTRIGRDALGDGIAEAFGAFGLDTAGLQVDPARPTGTVKVHMQGREHRFEIVADTAWDAIDRQAAVDAVRRAAPAIVYFGTLAQRSAPSREAIRAALAAAGRPALRVLDLNLRDGPDNRRLAEDSLALADIVKVNDDELDRLIDWFVRPGQARLAWGAAGQRTAIDRLMTRFDLRRLVITRGAAGWACRDAGAATDAEAWLEGTAPPAAALRDTVGAGDAYASVLLLGELRRWALPTTLRRAAAFASSVCGIEGAVDPAAALPAQAVAAWTADERG